MTFKPTETEIRFYALTQAIRMMKFTNSKSVRVDTLLAAEAVYAFLAAQPTTPKPTP